MIDAKEKRAKDISFSIKAIRAERSIVLRDAAPGPANLDAVREMETDMIAHCRQYIDDFVETYGPLEGLFGGPKPSTLEEKAYMQCRNFVGDMERIDDPGGSLTGHTDGVIDRALDHLKKPLYFIPVSLAVLAAYGFMRAPAGWGKWFTK